MRIAGLILGATALTTSTRLWGEQLRYEYDVKQRDERIELLTKELQVEPNICFFETIRPEA
jgi:hypothetical protein